MEVFKIGQAVWVGDVNTEKTKDPCPVCYGKKYITVILGNRDRAKVACNFCDEPFYGPRGWVYGESRTVVGAHQEVITGMDIREDDVTYWFGGHGWHDERVAVTKEEALEKAKLVAIRYDEQHKQRTADLAKHDVNKTYAWNVGHYKNQLERAQRDIEFYTKKIEITQAKIKEMKHEPK
jgi:hypothetical protein